MTGKLCFHREMKKNQEKTFSSKANAMEMEIFRRNFLLASAGCWLLPQVEAIFSNIHFIVNFMHFYYDCMQL